MKKVILGATGSIGSSLAKKLVDSGEQVHLVGRDENSLSELAKNLNSTFTVCDVLEENFSEKILNDLKDEPINGLALIVVTGPLAIVGPFLDVVEGNIELLLIDRKSVV